MSEYILGWLHMYEKVDIILYIILYSNRNRIKLFYIAIIIYNITFVFLEQLKYFLSNKCRICEHTRLL